MTKQHWMMIIAAAALLAGGLGLMTSRTESAVGRINAPDSKPSRSAARFPSFSAPESSKTAPASAPVSSGSADSQAAPALLAIPPPVIQKDANGFEVVQWSQGRPHYEGEPVVAQVTTGEGKRKLRMEVNQLGEFPRVQVGPAEKVDVKLQFQTSKPGMPLALTAQDGGALADKRMSQMVTLDAQRSATFAFTASDNVGMHRVSVNTPTGEVKTFDFWVGEPNVLRSTAQR